MAYQPKSYKKFVATAATATLVASALVPTASAASFSDVNSNYKVAVDYLVANKIAQGTSETTFGTTASITRGDAAVMIANALKLNTSTAPDAGFTDLNTRVAGAVNALAAAKIIGGKSATKFAPDDKITRQEMAKVVSLAYELDNAGTNNKFVDVNSNWDAYVDALVKHEVTLGKTPTTFGATQNVTRGEFALFVYRAETLVPATPEVVSVSAINAKEVEVKFNKAIDKSTVLGAANAVINLTLNKVGTAVDAGALTGSLSADGKTLTIKATNTFSGSYTVVATDDIEATDGTVLPEYKAVVTFVDNVRPTVGQAVYYTNNVATFSFSEPIDVADSATLAASLTLKDASGATYTPTVVLSTDKKSFTLDLNNAAFVVGKAYTLSVTSLKDFAGNLVSPNPTSLTVEKKVVDSIAPTVSTITSSQAGYVVVNFSEKVAVAANGDVALVSGVTANLDTNASLNDAGTVLTVRSSTFNGTRDITVSTFADAAGNLGTSKTSLVNFPVDSVKPTVSSSAVKSIDNKNYLVLTFSEDVTVTNAAGSITGSYVTENGVEKTVTAIDASVAANVSLVSGTKNQVKVLIDSQEKGNYSVSLPANLVTDVVGNQNVATSATYTVGANASETTKPTIVDATPLTADLDGVVIQASDNNTVEIEFSEALSASSLNLNNFQIEGVAVASKAVFTDDTRTTVKLTLKEAAVKTSGTYNFTVSNVTDLAGNVMTSVTQPKAFDENDLPGLTSAALTSNDIAGNTSVITLTFDEALDSTTVVDATPDFDIFLDGVALGTATVTEAMGGSTNVVTLSINRSLTAAEAAKVITVKPATGFAVADLEGNLHPAFTSVTVSK